MQSGLTPTWSGTVAFLCGLLGAVSSLLGCPDGVASSSAPPAALGCRDQLADHRQRTNVREDSAGDAIYMHHKNLQRLCLSVTAIGQSWCTRLARCRTDGAQRCTPSSRRLRQCHRLGACGVQTRSASSRLDHTTTTPSWASGFAWHAVKGLHVGGLSRRDLEQSVVDGPCLCL